MMAERPIKTFVSDEELDEQAGILLPATGERQVGARLDQIAPDHLKRYQWAARSVWADYGSGAGVLDLGCGNGYGAYTLANYGFYVRAIDSCEPAILFAERQYGHPNITFQVGDLCDETFPKAKAAVAFEVLEHIEHDIDLLTRLRARVSTLMISVPNDQVVPYDAAKFPFHLRHYTPESLEGILRAASWSPVVWMTQLSKWDLDDHRNASVVEGTDGRTLIVAAT